MGQRTRYVICYDIPENKRRHRLALCLDGFGDRVQKSVFEALLERSLYDQMMQEIARIIRPEQDTVRVYPLCATCTDKVQRLGTSQQSPGEEYVFVV